MKIANSPPPNGRMPCRPRGEAPSWGGARFGNRFVDSSEIAVNVPANVAVSTDPPHWREDRLVLRRLVVASAGSCWIYWSAASGFAGGGAIQKCFRSVIPLDFWRVEALEENRKTSARRRNETSWYGPGCEFAIEDKGPTSLIRQTAIFDPIGARRT